MQSRMEKTESAIFFLSESLKVQTSVHYDRIDSEKGEKLITQYNKWAIEAIRESAKQQ